MTSARGGIVSGRSLWVIPALAGVLALFAPWLGIASTTTREIAVVAILALVVSGLNLSWGYGGEMAIGQVAMYCAGAYTTGIMAVQGFDWAYCLVASAVVAAVLGLITGLPSIRLAGWGLAVASFFLILLIPSIVNLPVLKEHTGGLQGLLGIPLPTLFGRELPPDEYYVVVIALLIGWLALMRNLATSRHASALRVVRESPVLARSLGLSVFRLKVMAYVIGAIPAGLAGSAFAFLNSYISPENFGFEAATLILAASVISTIETVFGAVIGAALLTLGSNYLGAFEQYSLMVYGAYMVVGGALLTNPKVRTALADLRRRASSWRVPPRGAVAGARADFPQLAGRRLVVDGVSKSFGGQKALDSVDMIAEPGQITALIGANGSGKTTLLNVVFGFYRPDSGTVSIDDQPLPLGNASLISRRGVGRTFQTPIMPHSMSTAESVAVGRYLHDYCGVLPAMLRLPRYRRTTERDEADAAKWPAAVGRMDSYDSLASSLPLGSRRLAEVARALATGATVLLLDESASGLDPADVEGFAELLRRLKAAGATIVLVEHNFSLISDVADSIYVLERGRLIAHGNADEIRNNEAVKRSYLGQLAAPAVSAETVASHQPTPADSR